MATDLDRQRQAALARERARQVLHARKYDLGDYEVGNVEIKSCEDNNREAKLGRPVSKWVNMGSCLFCFLLATTGVLWPIALGIAAWKYLRVRSIKYELTTQRLIIRSGLLSRSIADIELYRVLDTGFHQSLWKRLIGIGDVVLLSSDRTQRLQIIRAVADARDVRKALRSLVERRRSQSGVLLIETA
jgi:membrane protein YdbS with pleckstrin-like domain